MAEEQNSGNEEAAAQGGEREYELRNELEFLIESGRDKKVSLATIFQTLLRANVYVLLNKEIREGEDPGNVQGLMIQDKDGQRMMVMFTDRDRGDWLAEKNPEFAHPNRMPARIILDDMSEDLGLAINPGHPLGLQITAEGVVGLKRELGRGWLRNIPEAPAGEQGAQTDGANDG